MKLFTISLCALLLWSTAAFAETVKDRKGAVLQDRASMEDNARWIYNNFERGFELAREQNKPLLVVLRCVPCLACAGIDAQVLLEAADLAPLLDQFVCVRVINANALDLKRFQFDYDLSFSTMFFNGDGTVYGRYGSWKSQRDPMDNSVDGYKKALEGALAIHKEYPKNKAALAGKQGAEPTFTDPLEIPELAGRYTKELDWDGQVVQSCVHCHQIGDAIRSFHRKKTGTIPPEWVYPWPSPEAIGLELAPSQIARVQRVAEGSSAEHAGLAPGDHILELNGQPLISVADVSWVLHRAPESGSLTGRMKRGDREREFSIQLMPGWRQKYSDISKRVAAWGMRAMAFGGMLIEDLPDSERSERGLSSEQMALLIKHVGQYGNHAAAKRAGFQKDDILIQVGALSTRITESQLIGHLLDTQRPGDTADAVVVRNGEKVSLKLPMQ